MILMPCLAILGNDIASWHVAFFFAHMASSNIDGSPSEMGEGVIPFKSLEFKLLMIRQLCIGVSGEVHANSQSVRAGSSF